MARSRPRPNPARRLLDVGQPVLERERQLLRRGRAGLADVVAGIEIGCQRGISVEQNSIMSVTRRMAGSTGKDHSFWAMYSSGCRSRWCRPALGPDALALRRPREGQTIAAGALMVIDTETWLRSMPGTGPPCRPACPRPRPAADLPSERGESESRPISDGMSNAVDGLPGRAGSGSGRWSPGGAEAANWRMVHSRPRYIDGYTPRVYGYWPG